MLKDFKEFAIKGNVVDMAVGIIIGGAFSTIVKSLVDDVLTPPLGLILGSVDFRDLYLVLKPGSTPATTLAEAKAAGAVTVNYGLFLNATISFLIMAFAMFILVRLINKLRQLSAEPSAPAADPSERECPYCLTTIPVAAKRCRACTADVATVVG